jgi:hypothetical protein
MHNTTDQHSERETALFVAGLMLLLGTVLANSIGGNSRGGGLGMFFWGYFCFLAFRGRLTALRTVLRLALGLFAVSIAITVLLGDSASARLSGMASNAEVIWALIAGAALLTGLHVWVDRRLQRRVRIDLPHAPADAAPKDQPDVRSVRRAGGGSAETQLDTTTGAARIGSPRPGGRIAGAPTNPTPPPPSESEGNDAMYGAALREFESSERDLNVYARLLAECDGDEAKVRARYVAERVKFLLQKRTQSGPENPPSSAAPVHFSQATSMRPSPNATNSTARVPSLSDEVCLKDYRFAVLATDARTKLYQLDNGRFAIRRGDEIYIYDDSVAAQTAYRSNDGQRQTYLRDSVRQIPTARILNS